MVKLHTYWNWTLGLVLLGSSQTVLAGSLASTGVGESPDTPGALGGFAVTTASINNDNYDGSVSNVADGADLSNPNTVAFDVFFSSGDAGGLLGGSFNESQWLVSPTGGVTEYLVNITIHNDTGATMTGYGIELGFGSIFLGSYFPSNEFDGLDLDPEDFSDPDATQDSSAFATIVQGLALCSTCGGAAGSVDSLWWEDGGGIADGASGTIQFSWDIPDFDGANMPTSALHLGGPAYEFSFGQIAAFGSATPVPVPTALWLFGSGLVGLIGFAKRKKP